MAQASSAFANDGVMHDAHLITKIENAGGQIVEPTSLAPSESSINRLRKDDQYDVRDLLKRNESAAPYNYTMAGSRQGQLGQTSALTSGDQWVIGYTPDVVISQWLGFQRQMKTTT